MKAAAGMQSRSLLRPTESNLLRPTLLRGVSCSRVLTLIAQVVGEFAGQSHHRHGSAAQMQSRPQHCRWKTRPNKCSVY